MIRVREQVFIEQSSSVNSKFSFFKVTQRSENQADITRFCINDDVLLFSISN